MIVKRKIVPIIEMFERSVNSTALIYNFWLEKLRASVD